MMEQILLSSGSFDGVRETGGFGQPLHALYPQIRAVLASELEPDAAWLLAEPVVDRANNRIDWYTEGDPDRQPEALSELAEEQRRPILARVDDLLGRGRELAERYAGSGDPRRVQLGAILKAVLDTPAETEVFLVEGRPVITRWGFSPDRPWEMPGGPVGGPVVPPPVPAQPPRDVVVPQITMPELATAVPESAPPAEAPPTLELATEPPAKTPEPEPATLEPSPEPEPAPVATGSSPALDSSPLTPHPSRRDSSPAPLESELASPLRYVVVGSRYFWGVVTLAILLAVAAVWVGMGKSLPYPATGKMTRSPASDAELDRALTEAQRVEAELQAQFEKLLVQLAERRGQCSLPASDSAAASSARSQPPGVVPGDKAGSGLGVGTNRASPPPERELEDVLTDREPVALSRSQPSIESPVRTESSVRAEPPVRTQPPVRTEPPVKAEPTPEERREFTSRLSAAGAATGEITATLLWNGHGDLDLVVRCPSGRQLDYRNPAECGGTLDVDANASRANVSDRPVENVFWRAGKAAPGAYEIAVRYAPRKDEQAPRETPFQVRLVRNGQESVFKGKIRPNALAPVTTFTVER
jgi:hypothetical protein